MEASLSQQESTLTGVKIDNSHLIINVDISYTVVTASLKCFQTLVGCDLNQVSCHAFLVTFAGSKVQISHTIADIDIDVSHTIAVTDIDNEKWEEF